MIVAALTEQAWWYVARSAGFVSWGALTLSVLWGLALSTRLMGASAPSRWLLDAHRFLAALSLVFVGLHLGALALDSYVTFGWAELFVPMASSWQPGAVAWGIVALYLLVAIEVTSLLMNRVPRRLWRWVHFTSFAVYVLATTHVLLAGTDVTNPVFRVAALVSVQLIVFMVAVRAVTTRRLKRALRTSVDRTGSVDEERARRLADLRNRRAASGRATPHAASRADVEPVDDGRLGGGEDIVAAVGDGAESAPTVDPDLAARIAALAARRNGAPAGSGPR